MPVRIPRSSYFILLVSVVFTVFGCYQDRPRHFLVHGESLGAYFDTKAQTDNYIRWHSEIAEFSPTLSIVAYVRDVPGATIRCTFEDLPDAGGSVTLSGTSEIGFTAIWWSFIKINRAAWAGVVLHLRSPPKYTIEYSAPRSHRWTLLSAAALASGPVFAMGYCATVALWRRWRGSRRGFEVLVN